MTTTLLSRAREDRARLIEEALTRNGTLQTPEVEDLVRLALTVPGDLDAIWGSIKARLERDVLVGHPDELGRGLRAEFDSGLNIMRNVIQRANGEGIGVADLVAQMEELQRRRDRILESWPWSHHPLPERDPESLRRAKEEIMRGEGERIEEIVARLGRGEAL